MAALGRLVSVTRYMMFTKEESMKQHHAQAFTRPCFEAEQCLTNGWDKRCAYPNDDVTIKLTLNIGLE